MCQPRLQQQDATEAFLRPAARRLRWGAAHLQRRQLGGGGAGVGVRLRVRVRMGLAGALLRVRRPLAGQQPAGRLAGAVAWCRGAEV